VTGACEITPVGAVHDSDTCALPGVAVSPVGAGGTKIERSSASSPEPPPPLAAMVMELLAVLTVTPVPPAIVIVPVRPFRTRT
jgi:hypothetical protein